ncbi:copper chaperone [bacterium]|nr:MAG: copper chaperone [bacterium]
MQNITLKLSGLHCTSCAINIDLTIEDLPGVKNSSTNYAKSEAKITFDNTQTNIKQITSVIRKLGYSISE